MQNQVQSSFKTSIPRLFFQELPQASQFTNNKAFLLLYKRLCLLDICYNSSVPFYILLSTTASLQIVSPLSLNNHLFFRNQASRPLFLVYLFIKYLKRIYPLMQKLFCCHLNALIYLIYAIIYLSCSPAYFLYHILAHWIFFLPTP